MRRLARHAFTAFAALSLMLCVGLIVLLATAPKYWVTKTIHGTFRASVAGGLLSVHNTPEPSIGAPLMTSRTNPYQQKLEYNGFPAFFRYVRWSTHSTWVVTTPVPILMLLTSIVPLLYVWRWRAARRHRSSGLCPSCGYDLRATPGRCPECGTAAGVTP